MNPITPTNLSDNPNAGIGRFCVLKKEITISEAVDIVKKLTSLQFINLALARSASLGK